MCDYVEDDFCDGYSEDESLNDSRFPEGFSAENSADRPIRSLQSLLERVRGSENAYIDTIDLLSLFKRERRGPVVNQKINKWLGENRLEMIPSIDNADYYGTVRVTAIKSPDSLALDSVPGGHVPEDKVDEILDGQNTWVLSKLKQDGEELDYLVYGQTISDASELMKQKGRTKLPLFFCEKKSTLVGTVSIFDLVYDSVGEGSKLNEKALHQVPVVGTDENLFDWIPTIIREGFIYGRNEKKEIVQIYTAKDVAKYLATITSSFIRLNEVEELMRNLLKDVPDEKIKKARGARLNEIDLDGQGKNFSFDEISANDESLAEIDKLTFAEYIKCVADNDIWDSYIHDLVGDLSDDRSELKEKVIRSINDARLARNSVMHFKSEADSAAIIPALECLAVWLRNIFR
ncbi:hypothetical protein [Corynebacterium sp. CCM 9203]|uniref:hypothetical protein n=1 Tax=Corynebacterium sp. CCM 9203 TaxID=3057615 RepID=UPI0035264C67